MILSQFTDPTNIKADPFFGKEKVRQILAVSWLFFMLDLGFAFIFSAIFAFNIYQSNEIIRLGEKASLVLEGFMLAAILCLALVLVAYVEAVGWVVFGLVLFFVPSVVILWIIL